jgi:hypothetical protein
MIVATRVLNMALDVTARHRRRGAPEIGLHSQLSRCRGE